MNAARLDYLEAQLELQTLHDNHSAMKRISQQIANLVGAERPKTARKARS